MHHTLKPPLSLDSSPNLQQHDAEQLRQDIKNYFLQTFSCYESLFECLTEQGFYHKAIALRHPLIFYYGHTATFFVNKLLLAKLIPERVDPHFEALFAIGVDEMSWDDLDDRHYEWPSIQAVHAYRQKVKALVLHFIDTQPLQAPINWQHPWWAVMMAIEHERIHLETSSVLIRQQHLEYVLSHPQWRPYTQHAQAPLNSLVSVPPTDVCLYKTHANPFYGWDNEYGVHKVHVKAFAASRYLVSNQEFLGFVEDDGYTQPKLWSTEGQAWLEFSQAKHPTFWLASAQGWQLRLMTDVVTMPWNWPVEINFHEAKAFCNWKSKITGEKVRLPSEDEWYALYQNTHLSPEQIQQYANLQLNLAASSCPVDHFIHGEFYDVQGNVWQWTETPIYPFDGFQVHPLYDDFTTPTFDGEHHVIKGGSWISSGNEILHSARYAFRRHFFQHAGFRYVVAETDLNPVRSHYETDKLAAEYLEFQYGESYFGVANFAKSLVELAIQQLPDLNKHKALDLGCATGRASFELARYFDQVTGIDFSARFIQHGVQLAERKTIHYSMTVEGELVEHKACHLADFKLDAVADKVSFFQGDACNLKAEFSAYDFILAANLIDRLHHPKDFLSDIHRRLNIGGVLMLTSPYTWLTEHTPRSEWVGGFKQNAEKFTTLDGLKVLLAPHFEMIEAPCHVEFVIRETQRKFQHSLSEVTLWRRKY